MERLGQSARAQSLVQLFRKTNEIRTTFLGYGQLCSPQSCASRLCEAVVELAVVECTSVPGRNGPGRSEANLVEVSDSGLWEEVGYSCPGQTKVSTIP